MPKPRNESRNGRLAAMREFQQEFRKQLVALVTAAFAFVAALFWNTAITDTIKALLPVTGTAWMYEIVSAVIVTVVAVVVVYSLSKLK